MKKSKTAKKSASKVQSTPAATIGKMEKTNNIGVRPLGDRVLVKPLAEDMTTKSPSGIIIPETVSKEKPEQGEVVAVGEGRIDDHGELIAPRVRVGDTVLFSKYGFDEVKIGEVEYFILKEDSILAVVGR